MTPAGLGEGPHNVQSYPLERRLYYWHGDKEVSDCGPRRHPLALGAPLTMALHVPFYPRPIKPREDPLSGLVHAQMGSQEEGVGHKKHLAYVRPGNYQLFPYSFLSFRNSI